MLKDEDYALILKVVKKHNTNNSIDTLYFGDVAGCDLAIDALATEFVESGLDSDDEPNSYGYTIENLIDVVNNIAMPLREAQQ